MLSKPNTTPPESTTPGPASTATTSPQPTEFTGATEDSVLGEEGEIDRDSTPLSIVNQEIKLAENEVKIERDMVLVKEEENRTRNAIDLLQCEHYCAV